MRATRPRAAPPSPRRAAGRARGRDVRCPPRRRGRAAGTSWGRRTASSRRREGGGDGVRREAPEVAHLAAPAQRPEQAEHEPVDVEERQPVGDHVLAGPRPRLRQPVQVGGDGPPRQDAPFGAPVVPERVDDQRGGLAAGLRRRPARRRGRRGRGDPARRGLGRAARCRAPRRSPGRAVGEHVLELRAARPRVDGHERGRRRQAAHRRDAGLELARPRPRRARHPPQPGRQRGADLAQVRRRRARGHPPRWRAPIPARGRLPAAVRSTPSSLGAGSQASQRGGGVDRRRRRSRGAQAVYVNGGLLGGGVFEAGAWKTSLSPIGFYWRRDVLHLCGV